ncbi:ABC transporter ATP-binding protein [Herbiconiux moechotypicola]|uniref:ABC transporter ATP-binding protein n=1 Tax=Herbiconiux moechotypicola TaxID=637393 RepID=A0ABP5QWR7_9MICO|nr:ABC transporter ATP-binding protein [Herbiconiux moechotypicola]MCS5731311.1 ABC transporter ATP-binding protein [Herbiconiux moechotypicola]
MTALLELSGVGRSFGVGAPPVLHQLDLVVHNDDFLAITGPSGAGKSTLLNILGLLDRPTEGEYRFDGAPTRDLRETERAALRGSGIGFVFQGFHLLAARTVLENVLLAFIYGSVPRHERTSRARDALTKVGLTHRMDAFPGTLSGGERQRVAIARAVCTGPRLLLADEPTGNLDQANADGVMRLFAELNDDGLAVVMITHDREIARRARRHARLSDGRLDTEAKA